MYAAPQQERTSPLAQSERPENATLQAHDSSIPRPQRSREIRSTRGSVLPPEAPGFTCSANLKLLEDEGPR